MEFFDGFLIDIYAFVISSNGFAAEVVNLFVFGILFDNNEITFGDVILTLETIKEVESLVEVGNAEDIDSAEDDRKYKEWDFDSRFDLAVYHDDTKPNCDDSKYNKRGYEICIWQKVDRNHHGTKDGTTHE